jgi:hypothetical protein
MHILLLIAGLTFVSSRAIAGPVCEAAYKYIENNKTAIKELIKKRPDPALKAYDLIKISAPYIKTLEDAKVREYYSKEFFQKFENICGDSLKTLMKELNSAPQ